MSSNMREEVRKVCSNDPAPRGGNAMHRYCSAGMITSDLVVLGEAAAFFDKSPRPQL